MIQVREWVLIEQDILTMAGVQNSPQVARSHFKNDAVSKNSRQKSDNQQCPQNAQFGGYSIESLPDELLGKIASYCSVWDVLSLRCVSRRFKTGVGTPSVWNSVLISHAVRKGKMVMGQGSQRVFSDDKSGLFMDFAVVKSGAGDAVASVSGEAGKMKCSSLFYDELFTGPAREALFKTGLIPASLTAVTDATVLGFSFCTKKLDLDSEWYNRISDELATDWSVSWFSFMLELSGKGNMDDPAVSRTVCLLCDGVICRAKKTTLSVQESICLLNTLGKVDPGNQRYKVQKAIRHVWIAISSQKFCSWSVKEIELVFRAFVTATREKNAIESRGIEFLNLFSDTSHKDKLEALLQEEALPGVSCEVKVDIAEAIVKLFDDVTNKNDRSDLCFELFQLIDISDNTVLYRRALCDVEKKLSEAFIDFGKSGSWNLQELNVLLAAPDEAGDCEYDSPVKIAIDSVRGMLMSGSVAGEDVGKVA